MVAEFTVSPSQDTFQNMVVTFIDQSTDDPDTWLWNFGDGFTSTEQNPSHVYRTSGYYTVSLTAGNLEGSDTIVKTEYVRVNLYGVSQKHFYIEVYGSQKTWDLAPPTNEIYLRIMSAIGDAKYITYTNGFRIVEQTGSQMSSGFRRYSGPSLIFD